MTFFRSPPKPASTRRRASEGSRTAPSSNRHGVYGYGKADGSGFDCPTSFSAWPGQQGNDYHPPTWVGPGEAFVNNVYTALTANPEAWKETLLIITFDEHGGTYDHVDPGWDKNIEPGDNMYGPDGFPRPAAVHAAGRICDPGRGMHARPYPGEVDPAWRCNGRSSRKEGRGEEIAARTQEWLAGHGAGTQ